MDIQETIKKAIEGGWRDKSWTHIDSQLLPSIFIDPLLWQALGKALGWETTHFWDEVGAHTFCRKCGIDEPMSGMEEWSCKEEWKIKWHTFIDHLIEGKSAEDYFKEL